MTNLNELWDGYVDMAAEAFRATGEEKARLSRSKLARLIATLPAIAGCEDAEKTGFINLCLYKIERQGAQPLFLHDSGDDDEILHRLEPFMRNMKGGDRNVVDSGMARMGLVMLSDYREDVEEDRARGKYNPVAEGVWDYDEVRQELVASAELSDNPDLNATLAIDESELVFWEK